MKTRHDIVWDNATLQGASAPLTQKVFGNSVCGVRIQNRSVWVLMVTETATGAPVEELPPFSWVLIPNPVDYTFQLLVANNNLTKPADMRVSVTYVDTPVTYAYGSISTQNGQSNPYVTGEVGLSAGTTVSLPAGTSVTLADGSTVALASGTAVDLASGATVGIDSNSNGVNVQNPTASPVNTQGVPNIASYFNITPTQFTSADTSATSYTYSMAQSGGILKSITFTTGWGIFCTGSGSFAENGEAFNAYEIQILNGPDVIYALGPGTGAAKIQPNTTLTFNNIPNDGISVIITGYADGTTSCANSEFNGYVVIN